MAQFETWERETLNQFARDAREKLLNMPRWISVDTATPDTMRNVLAYGPGVTEPIMAMFSMGKWYCAAEGEWIVGITHWMPVPSLP